MTRQPPRVMVGVRLPKALHTALKHDAIERGTSAQAIIEKLVQGYLAKRGKRGGR